MDPLNPWQPRSIECLRGYTFVKLTQDLVAGLTVGLVALPLAMPLQSLRA
jgi:sulfate permease, SulP family